MSRRCLPAALLCLLLLCSCAEPEVGTFYCRAALDRYLRENLCVPIITELEDSLWSGVYLYGTDNHLSTEGAAIHTERAGALAKQAARKITASGRHAIVSVYTHSLEKILK